MSNQISVFARIKPSVKPGKLRYYTVISSQLLFSFRVGVSILTELLSVTPAAINKHCFLVLKECLSVFFNQTRNKQKGDLFIKQL